jgi:hypothetical protein
MFITKDGTVMTIPTARAGIVYETNWFIFINDKK